MRRLQLFKLLSMSTSLVVESWRMSSMQSLLKCVSERRTYPHVCMHASMHVNAMFMFIYIITFISTCCALFPRTMTNHQPFHSIPSHRISNAYRGKTGRIVSSKCSPNLPTRIPKPPTILPRKSSLRHKRKTRNRIFRPPRCGTRPRRSRSSRP